MKKIFTSPKFKKVTSTVLSLGILSGAVYTGINYDFLNVINSAFGSEEEKVSSMQTLYKEELVERDNIIVGITESGSVSLISNILTSDYDVDVTNVAVKTGQTVEKGDFIANITLTYEDDIIDAYEKEYEALEDQYEALEDQQENLEKQYDDLGSQHTSLGKQYVNLEDQYEDLEYEYEELLKDLEDLHIALEETKKDYDKTMIDVSLDKLEAEKKLEDNLQAVTKLETSNYYEQADQSASVAKMERDIASLYDDKQSIIDEIALGYTDTSGIESAEEALADIISDINQNSLETKHAETCDADTYLYNSNPCTHLAYEHDLTKLATSLVSLRSQRDEAIKKIDTSIEEFETKKQEWEDQKATELAKMESTIFESEVSFENYLLNLESKQISTEESLVSASYTVETAQNVYESTMYQIESTIVSAEAKITTAEKTITTKEKAIENKLKEMDSKKEDMDDWLEDMDDVLDDMDDILEDIADLKLDMADKRQEMRDLSYDKIDKSIYAPASGYVMSVSEEETVKTGTSLITVGTADVVKILVSISQEDISDVYIGMPVNLVLDAYEEDIFRAEIDTISMTTASGMQTTVNYVVTILCDISQVGERTVYDGMTGDVTFIQREKTDVIVVSNKCVFTDDNGNEFVKIKNDLGEIETVQVTTGFSDGFDVEIVEGLNEGDIVVIESAVSM